jgi:hypothetical protein
MNSRMINGLHKMMNSWTNDSWGKPPPLRTNLTFENITGNSHFSKASDYSVKGEPDSRLITYVAMLYRPVLKIFGIHE